MPGRYERVGGIWRKVAPYERVGNTWREIVAAFAMRSGIWRMYHKREPEYNSQLGGILLYHGGEEYYVAPANRRVLRQFGSSGTARGVEDEQDGMGNTNKLLAFSSSAHPAAHYARSLGPDWFTPALLQIRDIIFANMEQIDATDPTINGSSAPSLEAISNGASGNRFIGSSTEVSSPFQGASILYTSENGERIGNVELRQITWYGTKHSSRWAVPIRKA